jgi:catechol 2,3-dioxygenase-like lactoylglutathione lyase family enzyme
MPSITGLDHIAITVADLEATCAFYDRLFGVKTHIEVVRDGRVVVRQILLGGAMFSVHQAGNGVTPIALRPTEGSADICLRWDGDIDSAIALLNTNQVEIIVGPAPRRRADGVASQSIYFRDPDQNLLELMAAD